MGLGRYLNSLGLEYSETFLASSRLSFMDVGLSGQL